MAPRLLPFARASLAEAAEVVKSGGLLVYPTDTVYGLGCDPLNGSAVESVFAAKAREGKPIPILCDGIESARRLARFGPEAEGLAERFWPGGLTIVLPIRAKLPFLVHQGSGTVGVRVPGSELCRELVRGSGGFLTGTSANLSGGPPCRTALDAMDELGDAVHLALDGGRLDGLPSTVVAVRGSTVEVLREGAVRVSDTKRAR